MTMKMRCGVTAARLAHTQQVQFDSGVRIQSSLSVPPMSATLPRP